MVRSSRSLSTAAAAILVIALGVTAIRDLAGAHASVAAERDALAHSYGLIDAAATTNTAALARAWQDTSALLFFPSRSIMALQDELFQEAQLLSSVAGLELSRPPLSTHDLAGDDSLSFTIMINGNGSFEAILTFLRYVEVGPRIIHVSDLSLSTETARTVDTEVSTVRLEARLTAFILPPPHGGAGVQHSTKSAD